MNIISVLRAFVFKGGGGAEAQIAFLHRITRFVYDANRFSRARDTNINGSEDLLSLFICLFICLFIIVIMIFIVIVIMMMMIVIYDYDYDITFFNDDYC